MHTSLQELTDRVRTALPEGAFFRVWEAPPGKEDVVVYYFWGGEVWKRIAIPVKLLRRERGFSVRTGAEPKARGLSKFRAALVSLMTPDQPSIEAEIGNRLVIDDVQTVVQDATLVVIPEDNVDAAVERVLRFRKALNPYVQMAAQQLGLSVIFE